LFGTKAAAERFQATTAADMIRGTYVDPDAGRMTFATYTGQWRAVQVHRPSTAALVETNMRRHVVPFFGHRPIGSIRPSEVQGWVKERSAHLAPGTVELVYRYVVAVFRSAVADRIIATTPCVRVTLPRPEAAHVVPLATEEVEALVEAVPDRYRALVVMAAGTGVRQGEALGVTLDRLDFLRRSLRVDRQLLLLPGAPPALAPPKTEASVRSIPLPAVVVEALAGHLARFPVGPDGFVFTNDAGEPIRRTRFSDMWRPAVARAGVAHGTGFHALRHFYASLLIRHGESVKVVQARLGHASAAETLDTYSHLWPDSEDRTRKAIDDVLGVSKCAPDVPQEGTATT